MADLYVDRYISSITTQGRHSFDFWVTAYKLSYGSDSNSMLYIKDVSNADRVFSGNWDRNTKVTHMVPLNVYGRYIKLSPVSWVGLIGLRWGLTER